jgi:hypothetical protein
VRWGSGFIERKWNECFSVPIPRHVWGSVAENEGPDLPDRPVVEFAIPPSVRNASMAYRGHGTERRTPWTAAARPLAPALPAARRRPERKSSQSSGLRSGGAFVGNCYDRRCGIVCRPYRNRQ